MRLLQAAAYFDWTRCYDAYNPGSAPFRGQLDLFDDSRRDGTTVARRILSTAPTISIPARRSLVIHEEYWIVGMHEADSFHGDVIRRKYVIQRSDGLAAIQTPAQALSSAGGSSAYAARLWIKDTKEIGISSDLDAFLNIYLAVDEPITEGQLITLEGRLHWVRSVFRSAGGFKVAESDELDEGAMAAGVWLPRTYVPDTDLWTSGTPVNVTILRMRWQADYIYASASAEKFIIGDIKALIRASALAAPPSNNDQITLADGTWRVIDSAAQGDCYGLHLRRTSA